MKGLTKGKNLVEVSVFNKLVTTLFFSLMMLMFLIIGGKFW